ncbi:MAG TPA: 2-succinyl-5-enolpyruvyl-6-hydroxy-3-cyclohexene-1-carboxylic-acid synthase, partial [Myxococcaceae bacterium]|nr:2-succinyl-5-enolpyruvyl-6-hydroxy-3-cyclohexene-1-carboxylic-acid synthase [Myxococcaceae bacterium]
MAETLNQLWARALVEELVRGGVEHAVVCPGSRSTPLALACAEQAGLKTWSVIDERSAAFFALGIGKASGKPAMVVATSGTAGAHFYPAAIEAGMSGVPMVLVTADRPPELQGWGAAQTIDQRALFGAHVRLWLDVGIPEASVPVLVQLRAQVARAVAAARRPPAGAVHLNVPFREPLAPVPESRALELGSALAEQGREGAPLTRIAWSPPAPDGAVVAELAARLARTERGVIVCGPRDPDDGLAEAVVELGKTLGYPVLAEAASGVRYGHSSEVMGAYDAVLRSERFARDHRPELVLRVGGGLTLKGPQAWLDRSGAYTVQLSDSGALVDPQHAASLVLQGDAVAACRALVRGVPRPRPRSSEWLRDFQRAEAKARE